MDTITETRERADASIHAYNGVLLTLQRTAAAISGEESPAFESRISEIRSLVSETAAASTIAESGDQVARELVEFAEQRAYVRAKKEWALKQVTGIAARILASAARSGCAQGQELSELAEKISSISRLKNLEEVREELLHKVEEINSAAERVQAETRAQTLAMEGELGRVKERLAALEQLSETDPVTGLGNRRMAENAIRSSIDKQVPMSILMLDLNDFKVINDRHGHQQGDQVLQLVARGLKKAVSEADVVCRWGGDEFVVVMRNANKTAAKARAAAIHRSVFGEFIVDRGGKAFRVKISASIGVAEYRHGEDVFEFFERADQLMYAEKSRRKEQYATAVH